MSMRVARRLRVWLPDWQSFRIIESASLAELREGDMLWTIFVVLLLLWLLGMVSSYTMGGFIHILLIVALGCVLIRVIQGRRPVV